jgi:hypothetical protein
VLAHPEADHAGTGAAVDGRDADPAVRPDHPHEPADGLFVVVGDLVARAEPGTVERDDLAHLFVADVGRGAHLEAKARQVAPDLAQVAQKRRAPVLVQGLQVGLGRGRQAQRDVRAAFAPQVRVAGRAAPHADRVEADVHQRAVTREHGMREPADRRGAQRDLLVVDGEVAPLAPEQQHCSHVAAEVFDVGAGVRRGVVD